MKRTSIVSSIFCLAVLAFPLSIVPASAVYTTYTAPNEGAEVFDGPGSSVQARVQDTMSGSLYSLAMDAPISGGDTLNEGSFADGIEASPSGTLTVDILNDVYRIVLNAYPNENSAFPLGGTDDERAAAVQSAIWHLTDGFNPDQTGLNSTVIIDNYNLILGWIDGDTPNGEFPTYSEEAASSLWVDSASASVDMGTIAGPFTVHIQDTTSYVNISVAGGTLVDVSGTVIDSMHPDWDFHDGDQFYIYSSDAGSATITVSGEVDAPPGRIYIGDGTNNGNSLPTGIGSVSAGTGQQLFISNSAFVGTSTILVRVTFIDPSVVTPVPPVIVAPPVVVGGITAVRPTADTSPSVSGTLPATGVDSTIPMLALGIIFVFAGVIATYASSKLGQSAQQSVRE